jgi:hypothetical protein
MERIAGYSQEKATLWINHDRHSAPDDGAGL